MATSRATVEIVAQLRDHVTGPLKGITASIRSTFAGIRSLVTAGLGAGFIAAIKNVADTETALLRMSRTVRSSVEDVSALKFALDDLGIGSNNLKELLNQLEGKRSDALRGGGQARGAFGRLGVEISELRTLGAVEVLKQLSEGYVRAGRSADAAAQLQAIFGDRFREFLPLLDQGSAGFERLRRRADALGATISSADAEKAEQFTRAWTELTTVAGGLFRDLTNEILPALTKLIRELREIVGGTARKNEFVRRLAEGSFEALRESGGADGARFTEEQIGFLKELGAQHERLRSGGLFGDFHRIFNPDEIEANARKALGQIQDLATRNPIKIPVDIEPDEPPGSFIEGFRAKVASTKKELQDLFKLGEKIAEEASDILVSNTSKALDAIRNQTEKTRDALRGLVDGLIEDFTRLAQNELLKRLFNSLLNLGAAAGSSAGGGGEANGDFGFTAGAGRGGRLIGGSPGNKRLGGNLFGGPQMAGGGGTVINLQSNMTAEEQKRLVAVIMQDQISRNRQVRVAVRNR